MNRIAIGLSLALAILTNHAYGQNFDSIGSKSPMANSIKEIDLQYLQSKVAIEKILGKKIATKNLSDTVRFLLDENNKTEAKSQALGGVDSGGGTLVSISQTHGLLDLYLYNNEAFISKNPGLNLPNTPAYADFGFDALANSNSHIIPKTLAQIEKWKESSPLVAEMVVKALKSLPVYIVKAKLTFKDQMVFVPTGVNLPGSAINLGAFYVKDIGVFINKSSFELMSLDNQMGLLVHEALRHRQLSFASGMSNETLQKLTAKIISNPSPGTSLDNPTYLQGAILQKILRVAELSAHARYQADNICKERKATCFILEGSFAEIREYFLLVQDPELKRELGELLRTLRTIAFESAPSTPIIEELNFSLRNSQGVFRLANIAKRYNENPDRSSAEADALNNFILGLKQMGVLAD